MKTDTTKDTWRTKAFPCQYPRFDEATLRGEIFAETGKKYTK
jgi:hypothetical protein